MLLSIAKLQNLKAIHNGLFLMIYSPMLLSIAKLQNLKAIHNKGEGTMLPNEVVINHKTTKFESNSQRILGWQTEGFWLLSITKLQNLKAIHNLSCCFLARFFVVINHKTTKFESNSQHKCLIYQIDQQ